MSAKKIKKYGNIDVSAVSLNPPDKDGYLTKQGGGFKSWKHRYFILKGKLIYYYKTPKDTQFTGRIELEPSSSAKEEPEVAKKKGRPSTLFSISTSKRVYFMYPENQEETKSWLAAIQRNIDNLKGGSPSFTGKTPTTPNPVTPQMGAGENPMKVTNTIPSKQEPTANGDIKSPRVKISLAKHQVSFLKDEDSKVLEFWQIWSESIPQKDDLSPGSTIDFTVATSADMQKLTWRTSGPQSIFIQKMVDFFWNVGAPESEIDRLNDVGADINPIRIGSWIDMSSKGGMDGGWYFPVEISLKSAIKAADPGEAVTIFENWATKAEIVNVFAVGRDMGAAPPRQTEFRFKLPPSSPSSQIKLGLDAFEIFGFPKVPEEITRIIHGAVQQDGCTMSVITSSEGFVRLGLLIPKPTTDTVLSLLELAGGNRNSLALFEGSLHSSGPSYVEYQYLQKGFGYGVYKEGFDIVFHYDVGEESVD